MPEISNRKNKKKHSPSKKKKKNKRNGVIGTPTNKLLTGAGLSWESTEDPKEEEKFSQQQIYMGIGVLFLIFMFVLWAFVDDRPEWKRRAQEQEMERKRNETLAKQKERNERNAALWSYNHAELFNSSSLSESLRLMQSGEDDRLMVVAFDDSVCFHFLFFIF